MTVTTQIQLNYQNALQENSVLFVPTEAEVLSWLVLTLEQLKEKKPLELTVRIVESVEIIQLNADYRQKNKPTNVLSFPFEQPEIEELIEEDDYLGDVVICAEVVNNEAKQQGKALKSHWQHMIVHGCLHLYGYDHLSDEEALEMESLEILILKEMGIASPYE